MIYVKIVGKIPDPLLSVWLFSNLGDKVQIVVESTGQVCPIVLSLFWTLSPGFENNHTFKCWSGIFPTILTYIIMLENCQNNISVYGCTPIKGTKFYSCWKLMKSGSQSGTYGKCALKKALTNRVALLFTEPCTYSDPLQIHFLCKHSSFNICHTLRSWLHEI